MIEALDHVNLRTARLAEMIDWYGRYMQMPPGPRPEFPFGGAWLYAGDFPLVHLVEIETAPDRPAELALEHAAFRASGIAAFVARLKDGGQRYRVSALPDFPIVQVNVWDPDGNHLHVDFDRAEAEAAGLA
ncbi:glyoxalase [Rhodobacterales bacterium HKCCE2091]|nr:glyoxalase [Rhodobacterales bacterium HKCCE2091]